MRKKRKGMHRSESSPSSVEGIKDLKQGKGAAKNLDLKNLFKKFLFSKYKNEKVEGPIDNQPKLSQHYDSPLEKEIVEELMRNHPGLTEEEARDHLSYF